jgi:ribosomal protection tetracycline resistance protein
VHRRTLNLGILAHVDAGKTSLTERLLHAAGVIDELGSVDKGTTQTDSLALERQRGITIRSAVVSFAIENLTVNLVDTPGHPDFIAEVERVLGVLDGVVLVVSAVEGVQPQTRVLMRALQRLRLPTLIFVNKIDRVGADGDRVLTDIRRKLTPAVVAITSVTDEGTRGAAVAPRAHDDPDFRSTLVEVLGEHDDELLELHLDDPAGPTPRQLRDALRAQTGQALVHPVFHGSAMTGTGVDTLTAGVADLLPAAAADRDGPVAGTVFKVERGAGGDRVAYVRMDAGTLRARDRVRFGRGATGAEGKVTAIGVFDGGAVVQRPSVVADEIAKVSGLAEIRIGDVIGDAPHRPLPAEFPPPTLESVVEPIDSDARYRLSLALAQLAEQDPLIDVRQDDTRREISISLYGEVQKEVIQATLATEYGIEARFGETSWIHVERPTGTGEAIDVIRARTKTNITGKCSPTSANPFTATLGLRVEPLAAGAGVEFRHDVDVRLLPFSIYKGSDAFADHMTHYVRETLQEGLYGWQVTDCRVTMTDCGYSAGSTAADFRHLTPLVVMRALEEAGTAVCEPTMRARVEIPVETLGSVIGALARLGAAVETPSIWDDLAAIEMVLSAARARDLQRQLSGLTHGEGVFESSFEGYRPVAGDPPARPRVTPDPLNLDEYVMWLARRIGG